MLTRLRRAPRAVGRRYGGRKLERARDLFEHALRMAPPEEAKPLFMEVRRRSLGGGASRVARASLILDLHAVPAPSGRARSAL